MSKTYDELQKAIKIQGAIRQMERVRLTPHSPPETRTEQTTTLRKEAPPIGSTDAEPPPLDRPALRDGYTLCVENATGLIADARTLKDTGRYRSAYLILSLALEELGGALQLYEAGGVGVSNWEEWWQRYSTHPRILVSPALDLARMEKADERFALMRDELVYVEFDTHLGAFMPPRADDDTDLHAIFDTEAAYAETLLNALPTHAFERWEFQEAVEQSPDIALSALYALVEQTASEEPTVSERDLLYAIARDLGRPPDEFTAGYEQWKKVTPKARIYLDVLRRAQNRLKKEGEVKETG